MKSWRKLNQPSRRGPGWEPTGPVASQATTLPSAAPARRHHDLPRRPHRHSCRWRRPQQAVSSQPTNPPGTPPRFAVATKMKYLPLYWIPSKGC
ncbi:hypothetical protein SETIT_6G185400v2 [Setaria italica]|uniref:Uncharacterized protein n=1 Tax=Setaria italica TaxID=4555 RepID=A0A368RMZ2_SETIT|nr:hypothetical protein SETIT_6G185400v2 [Setaria italica]